MRGIDCKLSLEIVNKYKELEQYIPEGIYCYDENGICPFWEIDKSKPEQLNGYCHLMREGDWSDKGVSLLWDQVKECGIKSDLDDESIDTLIDLSLEFFIDGFDGFDSCLDDDEIFCE